MTRQSLLVPSLILTAVLLSGCFSSGAFFAANTTEVQLAQSNYEVVATNVTGEASAGYLFGFSGSFVGQVQTFAIARIEGDGLLYAEALRNLWDNFADEYGDVEGQDLALVNVSYDTEALNVIFYTRPTVIVRADVVEFTGE